MKTFSYIRWINLFIFGGASFVSLVALSVLMSFDTSRLAAFGPTAQIYFVGLKNGFIIATIILFVCFIASLILKKHFGKIENHIRDFWNSLSNVKKNLLILTICFVFAFISHAKNIINGYFNMDDLIVTSTNHSVSFIKAVLTPYANDHMIPLYRGEMKVLDTLFGQNHIPYNVFVFTLFALIPFFTYLLFKRLGLGVKSFFIFLIIFTGAISWADMLTGFYIMSMYPQIILFFSIALWAYTAWMQSKEKKYLIYFSLSILSAVLINISGIWTIPTLFLFMICLSWMNHGLKKFIKENGAPILCLIGISIIFSVCFYISFKIIQPNTFLTTLGAEGVATTDSSEFKKENWKPLPLTENFLSFFANGVSLPLIVPSAGKILNHPAVNNKIKPFWPFVEGFIIVLNVLFLFIVWKNSSERERKLILWLLSGLFITVSMVIVARPNHSVIPDFDYRYAGVPFYFYSIFLAMAASIFLQKKGNGTLKIIVPVVIIIFAAQQAFSFQALRISEEAKLRREAVINLDTTLLSELNNLSKENNRLIIPNLSGSQIFQKMPGFTLANYILFFNKKMPIELIENSAMPRESGTYIVKKVESLRASTSPEFKRAIIESSIIRSYYTKPGLMSYETLSSSTIEIKNINKKGKVNIRQWQFDPENLHTVTFTLITDNIPGNLEISFSFENNLNIDSEIGKIRIDDYTNHVLINGKRVHFIKTDLLQLFPFALSEKISNLTIFIPDLKNTSIGNIKLF